MNQPVFSIGHSTKPNEDLVEMLQRYGIQTLIDVRSIPYSKMNPQFNREDLRRVIEAGGIKYEWRGNNIGGLNRNVYFNETCQELVDRAERGEKMAVMCSEGSYKACHRSQTIQPQIEACGGTMAHIQWDGTIVPPQMGLPL